MKIYLIILAIISILAIKETAHYFYLVYKNEKRKGNI